MSAKFNTLRAVAARAVSEGVVPGLVVVVGREGETLCREAFGRLAVPESGAGPRPATADAVYDLASLTKALSTSLLAMRAVQDGRLGLSDRLADLLPLTAPHASGRATVRELLCHASGLPAHRPFYAQILPPPAPGEPFPPSPPPDARAAIIEAAAAEPAVYEPGSRSVYSDLGFILLGALLEARLGVPLDRSFARAVAALPSAPPIAFAGPDFVLPAPLAGLPVAPTEACPVRGRLVTGEVHDLNAWAMGGVAGHAGLFGTAEAVATIAHALCAAFQGGPAPLVDRDVLRAFWSPAGVPGSLWRLGWDGPSAAGSLAGARITRAAVGHLAFTGCSLWIDPARATFVVMLSNRVHPRVHDDPRFRALRPALNDAALADAGYPAETRI